MDPLFDFTLRNAAMGAALLGLTGGVLGCFALLRRQSLLGDALSHAALPGICLGFLFVGSRQLLPLLAGALLSGVLAALVLLLLTRRSRLKEDAGLGIVLSVFFAIGTVLLTYIQGQGGAGQAGLETFLFGQAAAILPSDLVVMAVLSLIALGYIVLFWKETKLLTFDPHYARSLGLPTAALEIALTVLIATAIVIGLQLVGVVLMSAMLITPAAAARQWTTRLETMVVLAALFGVVSGVTGAILSATARGLSTGPVIVLAASALVLVSLLFAPERGLVWAAVRERQNRRNLRGRRVLAGLYGLARAHGDPEYRSEIGMVNALHGTDTRATLRRLEGEGLVELVGHMTEEGEHWRLTHKGYAQAERLEERP
jgi:manganese/zinc/iron transport system permease protein